MPKPKKPNLSQYENRRGIVMSGQNPTLILEGRKTQTRRVGKCQNDDATELGVEYAEHATRGTIAQATYRAYPNGGTARWALCDCPYGVAGDRLYVKETHWRWGKWAKNGTTKTGRQKWKFKVLFHGQGVKFSPPRNIFGPLARTETGWHKRPSIFLPKKLARIWLEITKVRVERLQDISAVDVLAEGVQHSAGCNSGLAKYPNGVPKGINADRNCDCGKYASLWDSLYGEDAWEKNPWVWVIEFRRLP